MVWRSRSHDVHTMMCPLKVPGSEHELSFFGQSNVFDTKISVNSPLSNDRFRFHSITRQMFHKAQAFLLMYDVSSPQSFAALNYWAGCIQVHVHYHSGPLKVNVGTAAVVWL